MKETIPADLQITLHLISDQFGIACTAPVADKESAEYNAYEFLLNGKHIIFRTAKITPTKTGQFVTIWKRIPGGTIRPFHLLDAADLFVICTRSDDKVGQFVFPKEVLIRHSIVSTDKREGKRGIRVYPPWDEANNPQARKTQEWQLEYFLDHPSNSLVDIARAKMLYGLG